MKKTAWVIVILLLFSSQAIAAGKQGNVPDTVEAKAVIDSMLSTLENWNDKAFAEFLPDTGLIQLGMNGGFLAFYVDESGFVKMIDGGMSIFCNPETIADLKDKIHNRELIWYIQSSYVSCEVPGDRDWVLTFFKDKGRYYLIKILDPNCGYIDNLLDELLKEEHKKDSA